MNSTQRYTLIFLCALVFLTVVAVLAAVFGIWIFDKESETTKAFAQYGQVAVLGEIIGLFAIVTRWVFSQRSGAYSLVISPHSEWSHLDLAWDVNNCYLKFRDQTVRVSPVLSLVGEAWEIRLPSEVFEKIQPTEAPVLILTDKKGNQWEGGPFYLFQRQLSVKPLADKSKILDDYGYTDE